MQKWINLINGPQEIGHSKPFWFVFALVAVYLLTYPLYASAFTASNLAYYLLNIPLAFGLSLLWGYGGILSFGQVAFFTIAGYAYGIIAGNLIGSVGTILGTVTGLGLVILVAAVFGYFVFYSRVQMWIVPILTLVLTLLLENFLGLTAGYQWRIGSVLLGGYNGMTGIPPLMIGQFEFLDSAFYYEVVFVVYLTYFAMRILVNSHFGQIIVAIREDVLRTEMLGYDVRLIQLIVFVIAAFLSAISGLLYVQWGFYITPSSAGLLQATLPIIWVAVGGRNSLIAVAITTYLLNMINYTLSSQGNQYAFVIMGALLVFVMLFTPKGIVVEIAERQYFSKAWNKLRRVNAK